MDKEKLQRFREIWKIANGTLTKEDFEGSFKKVLEIILRFEKNILESAAKFEKDCKDILGKIDAEKTSAISELKSEAKKTYAGLTETHKEKLKNLNLRFDSIKEGIIAEAVKKVVFPEHKETVFTSEELRDKLELLLDKERLNIKFIDGIDELEKQLREEIGKNKRFGGVGGFSKIAMDQHFIDDETPSGTINGINKIFTVAYTPNPTSSLKIFKGGTRQRITEDYTFSGRTITFNTAPVAGEIILCDYRT